MLAEGIEPCRIELLVGIFGLYILAVTRSAKVIQSHHQEINTQSKLGAKPRTVNWVALPVTCILMSKTTTTCSVDVGCVISVRGGHFPSICCNQIAVLSSEVRGLLLSCIRWCERIEIWQLSWWIQFIAWEKVTSPSRFHNRPIYVVDSANKRFDKHPPPTSLGYYIQKPFTVYTCNLCLIPITMSRLVHL